MLRWGNFTATYATWAPHGPRADCTARRAGKFFWGIPEAAVRLLLRISMLEPAKSHVRELEHFVQVHWGTLEAPVDWNCLPEDVPCGKRSSRLQEHLLSLMTEYYMSNANMTVPYIIESSKPYLQGYFCEVGQEFAIWRESMIDAVGA